MEIGFLVNIDNGGTFTDACVSDGSRIVHAKAPTTPHDLTRCFVEVLRRASTLLYGEEDLGRLIRETEYLRYSTTSGTNAIVERKGTPSALIVERGEEEALYGAAEQLAADSLWRSMVPEPPAGVSVSNEGTVDSGEITRVVNDLLAAGAQRLVIALRAPEAEAAVKEILLERYPRHLLGAIPFLLSYELVRDSDHVRRMITAVLNSYLHPGMEHFLYGAEGVCKQHHLRRPLLIFRNDGDSSRVAKTTAIKTWGSGPRGGVEGTTAYARLYELDLAIAMDIGGTTTDVTVVCGKEPKLLAYGDVDTLRTSFPLPDMHSFGLGGSSVVRVVGDDIAIGPDSTGAAPGPACFARGGTQATLTDALLLAGILDAESYLGGELRLDRERAAGALQRQVAEPLGVSVELAAVRVIEAFERQAAAIVSRAVTAAGRRPEDATLLSFGGGGPMIVCGIARAAGVRRVIVPELAAVFSAFGIGFSNLAHAYQRPLDTFNGVDVAALAAELDEQAARDMYGEGVDPANCSYSLSLWGARDGVVLERPIEGKDLPFEQGMEDTRLTLRAVYALPQFHMRADDGVAGRAPPASGSARVCLGDGETEDIAVYRAADLAAGHGIDGPALVRGDYLTCLVERGWRLRVTRNEDLMLEACEQ